MPEKCMFFGCCLRSVLLKGRMVPSPALKAPAEGRGEFFPQAVPYQLLRLSSAQV